MSDCIKCKGKLSYQVFDGRHEQYLTVECWDCLSVINYQDHVASEFTQLIRKGSPERLAQFVASFVVNQMVEQKGDLNRLEEIIKSKNLIEAFALCGAYSN
jgi:hypothetical protein